MIQIKKNNNNDTNQVVDICVSKMGQFMTVIFSLQLHDTFNYIHTSSLLLNSEKKMYNQLNIIYFLINVNILLVK